MKSVPFDMSTLTVTVVIDASNDGPQEIVVTSLEELYNAVKDLDPSVYTYVQFCNKGAHGEYYLSMTVDE